jgi:O-antigen ligase
MGKFLKRVDQHGREIELFFIILFLLLLLGDAKQGIGDIVAAAGIICLYVVRRLSGGVIAALPRRLNMLWLGLFLYFVGTSFFSDSIGYSVYASIKWVMAYVVFVLFYSISLRDTQKELFVKALTGFGILSVLTSFLYTLVEALGSSLPGMNLLYPTYGHNNIANIIIFVLPLALHRAMTQKSRTHGAVLVILGISLALSFARGAWILGGGYLLYSLVWQPRETKKIAKVIMATLFCMILLIVSSRFVPGGALGEVVKQNQIEKQSPLQSRAPYWKEAMRAIQERPVFGAGSGTYYLLSKRLQESPGLHSWFAHGFLLEQAAEVGLVGVGLIGLLFVATLLHAHRSPLFHGVMLTLLYSMYEMNLNFLIIWLLLWASLGMLYRGQHAYSRPSPLVSGSLFLLFIFYTISISASFVSLFPTTRSYAFYMEPYVVGRAVTRLEDPAMAPGDVRLVEFFHKKNPDVQLSLAGWYEKSSNTEAATEAYAQAAQGDPHNKDILEKQFMFLVKNKKLEEKDLTQINLLEIDAVKLAKDLYELGLEQVRAFPEDTKYYWTIAAAASPHWNYFHIEHAALEWYVFANSVGAQKRLDACLQNIPNDPYCLSLKEDLRGLPPVGSQKEGIMSIQKRT